MLESVWPAIEASGVGQFMRSASLAYPIANVAHILGAVMVAGAAILLDLRILGYANTLHAASVWRTLTPIAIAGFVVMVLSGLLLFAADAVALSASRVFQVKLLLVVTATINAALFRLYKPRLDIPPPGAKASAMLSILLWTSVLICGRLIAYL
ncbi:hypothetical protein [Caulobacter sp. NIBR2454]|uniref:hypothetical protein n=1 Tax=Caulobacter sp. NIBR2454 TaxID=3015996 RepID=UPI0022B64A58|nr:hypothetical protein [Caulobacter sp. NIBR2454]